MPAAPDEELIMGKRLKQCPVALLQIITTFWLIGGLSGCFLKSLPSAQSGATSETNNEPYKQDGISQPIYNDAYRKGARTAHKTARVSPPVIGSITQSLTKGRETISFTISGQGFDSGASVEVYNSSNKLVWSGPVRDGQQSAKELQVAVSQFVRDIPPGKYVIKVKNSDGKYSSAKEFTVIAPPNSCVGNFSVRPKVLFLGGGDAASLFERYLSQKPEIENDLPRDLKIKFYKRGETNSDPSLQTVAMGDMEVLFVEGQRDYVNKLKKQLIGKVAEYVPTLPDEAQKGLGDYFQCLPTDPKEPPARDIDSQ